MNLRQAACVLALLLTPLLASAQPNGGGPGPVLGIVEIPKLFSIDPQTGERQRAALTLYARPNSGSRAAVTVSSADAIDDAEYGYDEVSVTSRGWVPAHNQSGAPTVWFASRGC